MNGGGGAGGEREDEGFDRVLERLKLVVDKLEQGSLSLEDALRTFEEGVGLARRAGKYLDEAEKRIELLTRDESGVLKTTPFDLADEERA